MAADATPRWRTGKLCYIEIPSADAERSAEFYRRAFSWAMRRRGDGALAFDDTVGEVSGTFVAGRTPAADPGLLVYVMVADVQAAMEAVVEAGGRIVRPPDPAEHEVFAWFADPDGNTFGIYQQAGLAEAERAATADMPA